MNRHPLMRLYPLVFIVLATVGLFACSTPDKPTIELYVAIKRGDIDQIERHIYWKTDINQLDPEGKTPLHQAAAAGRLAIARLLLKNGAEINKLDRNHHTPLYEAIMQGRTQLASLLVKKFHADFDPTALLLEAAKNDISDRDVYAFLVREGGNINARDKDNNTPLTIAINHQKRVVAKHLIAHGANVNQADAQNRLPLDLALSLKNPDLVLLLKSKGARSSN